MEKNFDQPVNSNMITMITHMTTYNNIWKNVAGQGDDYITGCLLGYNWFNKYYKMITMNLSKQQALAADPKAI